MIIDTFLFSEPHESDLLYLKLLLEESQVKYWVLQENAYSTKGEFKGLFAHEVLKEARFAPFRDRMIICSAQTPISNSSEEGDNFQRENWQRTICLDALKQLEFNTGDKILVTDVDEMIDFSDQTRTDRFFQIVNQHPLQPLWIGRMRYWYDYDNRAYIPCIRIPVIPIEVLSQHPQLIAQVRHVHNGPVFEANEEPIAFEYSYVFKSFEDVWRKKVTYAHTGFTQESVRIALECNHWVRSPDRGETVGTDSMDWFEKVELTPLNSPKYVRENIDILRTKIISPDYKANRMKRYGHE